MGLPHFGSFSFLGLSPCSFPSAWQRDSPCTTHPRACSKERESPSDLETFLLKSQLSSPSMGCPPFWNLMHLRHWWNMRQNPNQKTTNIWCFHHKSPSSSMSQERMLRSDHVEYLLFLIPVQGIERRIKHGPRSLINPFRGMNNLNWSSTNRG